MSDDHGALVQLRAYLSRQALAVNAQLPPERELCELIGASRGELRKALAVLEAEGAVWRHVGKGTFVGDSGVGRSFDLTTAAESTNPREVMRARLAIEPALAGEAAHHASQIDLQSLQRCASESRTARTWRQYESYDNHFHKLVAQAAHNTVLSAMFDVLAGIRRTVAWSVERDDTARPPEHHHSFAEHEAIVRAIASRNHETAADAMFQHLVSVEQYLFAPSRRARPKAAERHADLNEFQTGSPTTPQ